MEKSNKRWYDNQVITHLLLIFVFPVGLYALWKSTTIAKWWKVTATLLIALIIIPSLNSDNALPGGSTEESPKVKLNQHQLDSIAVVKKELEFERRKNATITASKLFQEYEDNEVLADQNYKGQYLYVEGIIDDIGKDILDDIYVVLKTNNIMFGIQCYIDDENLVAQLKKGMKVTFYGRCDGKLGNVGLKDCKFYNSNF